MERREFLRYGALASAMVAVPRSLLRGVVDEGGEPRPWWSRGDFAPVRRERTVEALEVTGTLPEQLEGLYVRNGSNSLSSHWFIGDGMVHGVRLRNGRATGYSNRYVETKLHATATPLGAAGPPALDDGYANVSVFTHADRLLASGEVGLPWELRSEDLSTVGVYDFAGRLRTSMTAHPKIDPATGALHFFGYGFTRPYLTYHVADASGALVLSEGIDVGEPTMIHDFAITDRDVVFWELPVTFDLDALDTGIPFRWHPEYGARIGVMPLGGPTSEIRWVEIEPCYVFHGVNAFRVDDEIVMDVCRHEKMFDPGVTDSGVQTLRRWRIDTAGGALRFSEEILEDDNPGELPTRDPRRVGRSYRYGYLLQSLERGDAPRFQGVAKHDFRTGRRTRWVPDDGGEAGEFLFVPTGDGEDEGFLLSYVYRPDSRTSDLVVLDARDVEDGPVATVHLGVRVPHGFHGTWVPS